MTTKTATKATVTVGTIQFEGVCFGKKQYGITVKQIAKLFYLDTNHISHNLSRWVDGLNMFKVTTDRHTEGNPNENAISLADFERVIKVLFRRGNNIAELLLDACMAVGLDSMFQDAFGTTQTKEEAQAISHQRQRSIGIRKEECEQLSFNSICKDSWQYAAITNQTYLGLFGKDAKTLKEERNVKVLRDSMTPVELSAVMMVEATISQMASSYAMEWSQWLDFVRDFATKQGRLLKV